MIDEDEPVSIENELLNDNDTTDHCEHESDDHLPRVQIELDKLNYANESINNLELELEESKREYLRTMQETEEQLGQLEKKLGSCVDKSKPYYEARIELNESKDRYLKAKNRFETAQELYVAAKRMQMYAEESLENFNQDEDDEQTNELHNETDDDKNHRKRTTSSNYDRDTLLKMLEIAKIKVNDTELSKLSSDSEQIEAFKIYEEKRLKITQMEKSLKKHIEKSRKYFELKSNSNKELKFVLTKIEGLKSCLKEAKLAYQQSLKNLEMISTEIHTQRQTINLKNSTQSSSQNINESNLQSDQSKLLSHSTTTLSSSSSSLSTKQEINMKQNNDEDYDVYFNKSIDEDLKTSSFRKSASIDRSSNIQISDEELENLRLDDRLKTYKNDLDSLSNGKRRMNDSSSPTNSTDNASTGSVNANSISRPQFRVPGLPFLSKK